MRLILRMLAPTLAVWVFWSGFENAWMTLLAYHAQILFWSRHRLGAVLRGWRVDVAAVSAIVAGGAAGPLMFALLPHITVVDAGTWLAAHGLAGGSFLLMIPYFGVVHPILEQAHWHDLRDETPFAHAFFAGYHLFVLSTLISLGWLGLVFSALMAASILWYRLARRSGGSFVPACMHIAADLGVVLAAWMRTGSP